MKLGDVRTRIDQDLRTRAERTDHAQAERVRRLKAEMPEMKGVDVKMWGFAVFVTGLLLATVLFLAVLVLAELLWAGAPRWFGVAAALPSIAVAMGLLKNWARALACQRVLP